MSNPRMTDRRQADSPPSKLPRLSGADAYDGRGVSCFVFSSLCLAPRISY
jgi:hypothetical protein